MKKIIISLFLSFVLTLAFTNTAHASLDITANVDVPSSCNATDTDGVAHNYPKGGSYLAICALEAALGNGSVSSADLSNQYPSMGLFITAINGVAADPNSQYWALYQNGNYAASGLSSLPVSAGDVILLQLHDFSDNDLGDKLTLNINSLVSDPAPATGGGRRRRNLNPIEPEISAEQPLPKPVFDLQKAFEFLISQQKENGSFGEDIYTDWTAIALASDPNYLDQKEKLKKYILENKLAGTLLTDYERRSMALMSLGLDPYNINNENYIAKITENFDGAQFGDLEQDNDDIFALIVLQNAGFAQDEMIQKTMDFILSKQKENGSWDESVDMTGAGMEALSVLKENENVKNALEKAKNFLRDKQEESGGWGNVSSTSWAMQGILALGEKPEDWIKNDKTPIDYLAENQDADGGIKNDYLNNKIWETAYALSALSGRTWHETMQKFEQPKVEIIIEAPKEIKKPEVQKTGTKQISKVKRISQKPDKLANIASQNLAAPIVVAQDTLVKEPAKKQSWLRRFFGRIFGF